MAVPIYGCTVDVLAWVVEEGRDKLRKARGRSKYPLIPRLPNGVTFSGDKPENQQQETVVRAQPGELKHLSTRRKRNQTRFP